MFCGNCGVKVDDGAKVCPSCGWTAPGAAAQSTDPEKQEEGICASCGAPLKEGAVFCGACGAAVKGAPERRGCGDNARAESGQSDENGG